MEIIQTPATVQNRLASAGDLPSWLSAERLASLSALGNDENRGRLFMSVTPPPEKSC